MMEAPPKRARSPSELVVAVGGSIDESHAECPVCMEFFGEHIYQCSEGRCKHPPPHSILSIYSRAPAECTEKPTSSTCEISRCWREPVMCFVLCPPYAQQHNMLLNDRRNRRNEPSKQRHTWAVLLCQCHGPLSPPLIPRLSSSRVADRERGPTPGENMSHTVYQSDSHPRMSTSATASA